MVKIAVLSVIGSIFTAIITADDKFEMELAKGLRSQVTHPDKAAKPHLTD